MSVRSKNNSRSWEETITDEQRQRIIEIWMRSREALSSVVEEMKITQAELKLAGQYFNRLGQSEMFPSLMIVALGMTSLRVVEGAMGGTPHNVEGPFHVADAPVRVNGVLFEKEPTAAAQYLDVRGRVRDAISGEGIPDAIIDVWQADENGSYDQVGFHLRGRIVSDANGRYELHTIVPKDYAEHDDDPIGELFRAMRSTNRRAAHIHIRVDCEGYRPLTTQLFMPDADHLDDDYLEGAVIPELVLSTEGTRKDSHIKAQFDFSMVPESRA